MSQTGCAFLLINVSTFLNTELEHSFENNLHITVTLKEQGTDISMVKTEKTELSFQIGKVEFLNLPTNFERGSVLNGKIKVTTFSGAPIPNKMVYLSKGERWSQKLLFNLTTDSNGLADFSVTSPEDPATQIILQASVYLEEKYHVYKTPFFTTAEARIQLLQPATPYNPVFSELLIESSEESFTCGAEIPITINYYIVGETIENFSTDLIYAVLSKGSIVHYGHKKMNVEDSAEARKGKISFTLSVLAEFAPIVQVLAYTVLPSENVIAASKNFDVEKCFRNKVSLQFSPPKAVPGEKNTLELSAHPGSLCGLSAVDQSVFILESGDRLNTDKIFNLLPVTSVSNYPYGVEDGQECLYVRPRRDIQSDHVYNTLKGVGLKMATNLALRQPRCLIYKGVQYHRDIYGRYMIYDAEVAYSVAKGMAYPMAVQDSVHIETVRKFFPETWIWQLEEVGDSGSVQLPVTVPDTITTWETEAFCVSSKGLGLAPPVQLTVFQPFFLELSLPYSIIRGEVFELKATVFNYLSKCIMVKVTPAPSSDYTLEPSSDGEYSSCLCVNGRKTLKWTMIPSMLGVLNVTVSAEAEQSQTVCDNEIVSVPERGRIDTVTRSLIVKAEGTEKTKSQSWLLCPQGGSVSEELELTLPVDVIEGSARASVSVLGDILGTALKNLDGLLRMPYGCGEQNIALLAPNIYILQYLENTEQLTTAIRERATGFLKSGYQRQLNYKHFNGAYSTFGRGEGNTWLTAFVLRTFGKAQRYIFIDPEVINSAKQWLINMQRSDGCFIQQGRLFNNRMKGGVNDEVTITAYITASLLELGHTVHDAVVNKGLLCLKSSIGNMTNTYTTALMAYTFSLAGEKDLREQLLRELDSVAIAGVGHLHWSQSATDDSGGLSVEISSYVLIALLTTSELSAADLGYANRIVNWLVRQQNPYGGFSSTQDTVVALQALALYSTKVFSSEGASTVTIKSEAENSYTFNMNQNNKLLYQERSLQDVPGKYSIEVKGSSCVSVQTALFYNIPTPSERSTLRIMAMTDGNCTKSFGHTLAINFSVIYNGKLNITNMIIVDIKLLSGFTADAGELLNQILVERVDSKDDHIMMYIKELQRNIPINYNLHIKQVLPVKNLKPAVIKVYDYYQTNSIAANAMADDDSQASLLAKSQIDDAIGPNNTPQQNNKSKTLLQEKVDKEIHKCFHFEAPLVKDNSVQYIKVEVKGKNFKMTEQRKVMFKPYSRLFFIQTDKPIYNPGQTVNFRIVSMDVNFIPVEQKYTTVSLQDNYQNRIGQWTNVSSSGPIVQLFHELNSEALQGRYKIIADTGNRLITHHFKVEKHVLPKFEVTVKEHIVGDEKLNLEICGHYTYERPVPGQAVVQVCRMDYLCQEASAVEVGQTGCAFINISVSNLINTEFNLGIQLVAIIFFKEEGTDISVVKSKKIGLPFKVGKVEILVSQNKFDWRKAIEGKVKVTNYNGTPVANKKVYLWGKNQWDQKILHSLTTDGNGLANFSVASHLTSSITLMASVYPSQGYPEYKTPFFTNAEVNLKWLQPDIPYSPGLSELSIESSEEPLRCGAEIPIIVNYYIIRETTRSYSIDLIYMVLSKGVIVHHGHEKVEVEDSSHDRKGKILLNLSIVADMAPVMNIVVYSVLPSENVIAASRTFDVEKCFKNKVSLQFSPSKAVPGEKNTLKLSALPGSLCGLSAVDQSVFIVEPGDRLNIEKIYTLLPVTSVSGYPSMVEDNQECLHVRHSRQVQSDRVYDTLKRVGLKMATNLAVGVPQCLRYKGVMYRHEENCHIHGARGSSGDSSIASQGPLQHYIQLIAKDRKFFPGIWIWQLVKVGDSGSVELPVTVPDTITTWETEAFCMSPKGLGLAPPVQLTVFQPFFLELSLPYYVIRGEVFELKATVFNNLLKCIMVKVTPAPSSDYTLEPSSDGEYSSCLCANGRKTFKWTMIPSVLGVMNVTVSAEAEQSQTKCDNEIVSVPERGRIDRVTRSLIVQAEGTEKTKSQSWLLCPQGNSVSEEFELTLPENVIAGSARASVSVLGDTLGRALKNLDKLLRMVKHCGEGNIALLTSNVCILQYLKNTEQLTTAVLAKSTRFLKSGYQSQLKYKDINGAYSTFSGGKVSTWLTAFVLRTLGKAQHYISIDQEIINNAKQWLISMQRSDGCFIHHEHLYDNRMKGGVNDDVSITAYITLSFLELGMTVQDPVVNKGLICLKSSIGSLANTYTTALLAYTFSLARENETREQLLKELNRVAIATGDGNLHWSQATLDDPDALSVEISSYVLLAVLTAGQLSAADLGYANRIVRWLVKQQNPSGDFSSTQDTAVALQALALYSTKVFSSDGSSSVTVKSSGGNRHSFDVNENNKLLYQERSLQDIPGKYSIEVKGAICVSVQTVLFYNAPTPPRTSTLSITATTEADCTKSFRQILTIKFTVTYNGRLNSINMIIVDIKLLSGFIADPFQLGKQILVEQVYSRDEHIGMYIKELQRNIPINYELQIQQVLPVRNIKPAVIKVYDYYQTRLLTVRPLLFNTILKHSEQCGFSGDSHSFASGQPLQGFTAAEQQLVGCVWDRAMESPEGEGRTFMQVISEKYSPENFPYRRGPGMGVVVPPGHQGSPMKDRLNLPSVLVLNGCGISHAGDQVEIAAFCAHVVELDLSDNKLQDWHEISRIVMNIPNLDFLNLSSNPLSDSALESDCAKALSRVRRLVLNNTQISWDIVNIFTCEMPELEELFLCLNEYSTVMVSATPCPSLRLLHITDNNLQDWNEVRKFGTMFPSLDTLVMANNYLNSILDSEDSLRRLFPHLRSINLHNSGLSQWEDIEKLNFLPKLEEVRLQGIPLLQTYTTTERRSLMIAQLPSVSSLNGSIVTGGEREDAERFFIRYYRDHPEEELPH
ncbi:alpha-2-macroglobulin-like, partial [Clarias magur]